jgi:uncharacterized protein YndB with AHSA1/START domain
MPTIYHDFNITAEPEKVFDAFTQPCQLECWWPKRCSGKVELGAEYNFYFGEPYDWYAQMDKLTYAESVQFKMTKCDPDWEPTTFGIEMSALPSNATAVSFFHKDWTTINKHFRIASFCWAMLLNGLKNYVEQGVIVPFEKRS